MHNVVHGTAPEGTDENNFGAYCARHALYWCAMTELQGIMPKVGRYCAPKLRDLAMSGQGFHESFGESRKCVNGAVFGYLRRRIVWHVQRLARTLLLIRVRLLQGSCVGECLRRAALEGLPPFSFYPAREPRRNPLVWKVPEPNRRRSRRDEYDVRC